MPHSVVCTSYKIADSLLSPGQRSMLIWHEQRNNTGTRNLQKKIPRCQEVSTHACCHIHKSHALLRLCSPPHKRS
eukprot:c50133_g1_i1 orf=138-362(-)